MKWLFGRTRSSKKRKRKILILSAAVIMFSGIFLPQYFKVNSELFLLGGFSCYTLSELFE
jgi:F0F1-type ATP synthase assembly protein I